MIGMIGMEQRRRLLMAKSPGWGDVIGAQPMNQPQSMQLQETLKHVSSHDSRVANSEPESSSSYLDLQDQRSQYSAKMSRGFVTSVDWSLETLLGSGKRFLPVQRISALDPTLGSLISQFEQSGIPLVIADWHRHPKWPQELFSIESFCALSKAPHGTPILH
jgi:hypothetical protein